MSNVYDISPEDRVYEEASVWISRLDKGLSLEEEVNLNQWLEQSERHGLILIKMGETWDKAEVLSKLADLFPKPVEHRTSHSWTMPAMAASIAALALSIWFGLSTFSPLTAPAELAVSNLEGLYKTAIGEHISVSLPDGTELNLNTNTTVRVNYSDLQRVLILEQGELHVDVAHDVNRPLSVLAGGQIVQAVGTAFNIELSADQKVDLVVTEGRVLVGKRENIVLSSVDREPVVMPATSFSVSQGERILLGELALELEEDVETIDPADIEVQLSWQSGNLVFRGEPLVQAIEEISRYTEIKFEFLDENLKQVQVAGLFQTGDVDGLLVALSDNFNIHSQRIDQRVLLGSLE